MGEMKIQPQINLDKRKNVVKTNLIEVDDGGETLVIAQLYSEAYFQHLKRGYLVTIHRLNYK